MLSGVKCKGCAGDSHIKGQVEHQRLHQATWDHFEGQSLAGIIARLDNHRDNNHLRRYEDMSREKERVLSTHLDALILATTLAAISD